MSDTPRGLYKMRTIARRSGFSPALLRAWEARHALLEPERGPGGHRAYTDDDLRVLRRVRAMLAEGRAIGEIALLGRPALLAQPDPAALAPALALAPARPDPAAPDGGLAGLGDAVVRAAVAHDGPGVEAALDEAFARVSPEVAIRDLIEPAAREIGELWSAGRCSVAGEHLASAAFARRIDGLRALAAAAPAAPPVICACFPDEEHAIGALALAFHLGRAGYRATYLGARLPIEDLEVACAAVHPVAVCISVTREALFQAHRPRLLEWVGRWAGRARIVIGGQGAPETDAALIRTGALLWPRGRPAAEIAAALAGPPGPGAPQGASAPRVRRRERGV